MENLELQKRVKVLRARKGLSQEELADSTGLSIRTIQRIENGESIPRGDTLKRLAVTLQISPDELIDWKIQKDNNIMMMLHLSQMSFLAFPLLGVIIPLAIWILKRDKIKFVDTIGKSILNFQITWSTIIFLGYFSLAVNMYFRLGIWPLNLFHTAYVVAGLYFYNSIFIIVNTIAFFSYGKVKYFPAIQFLR